MEEGAVLPPLRNATAAGGAHPQPHQQPLTVPRVQAGSPKGLGRLNRSGWPLQGKRRLPGTEPEERAGPGKQQFRAPDVNTVSQREMSPPTHVLLMRSLCHESATEESGGSKETCGVSQRDSAESRGHLSHARPGTAACRGSAKGLPWQEGRGACRHLPSAIAGHLALGRGTEEPNAVPTPDGSKGTWEAPGQDPKDHLLTPKDII